MMKWKEFGRNLLETTNNEKLTLIKQDCNEKKFKFKCEALLEAWKKAMTIQNGRKL